MNPVSKLPNFYVIVFNASPETLEDGLSFFASDLHEARLGEIGLGPVLERVVGVPVGFLNKNLTFRKYFGIHNDKLLPFSSEEPLSPAVVHFLHFGKAEEIETHRYLSNRFNALKIKMINPYQPGTSNCDSKFRMFQVLKNAGVPTPDTRLISRFNQEKIDSLKEVGEEFSGTGLYIQPDRGTEGEGCLFLEDGNYEKAVSLVESENKDFIMRKKTGNSLYQGKNFILRLNVCFAGGKFYADSGYGMVGGQVVSAARGAKRVNINELISHLSLEDKAVNRIKATASKAARAIFAGEEPSLLVGIDLVLEKKDEYLPYIIDINPRPVVVGSRIIGSNRIGLGEYYWQGVKKLIVTA